MSEGMHPKPVLFWMTTTAHPGFVDPLNVVFMLYSMQWLRARLSALNMTGIYSVTVNNKTFGCRAKQ
jgi:hypothetical protein